MNKYRNKRTKVDGIEFASKREAIRYSELLLMVKAKMIKHLELQVPFRLIVGGQLICKYIADFRYMDSRGQWVIEDAKGVKTPVYQVKKKLMKALYNIEIVEV